MQIAVLGTDSEILRLVRAAISMGHEIVWIGDVRAEDSASLAESLAGPWPAPSDWETLLDHASADAVLVGSGAAEPDLRAEQLKRLAADAVPMLIVHPICSSVLTYYELDMIRRESRGIVRHYDPFASYPALEEIAAWIRDGHPSAGPIHQLSCDRRLANTGRDAVLRWLARDSELLAKVAGSIRRTSAIGPSSDQTSFASLQVQLTAENLSSLRWSVVPDTDESGGVELKLVAERGLVTLRMRDALGTTERVSGLLEVTANDQRQSQELPSFDSAAAAIEKLANAVNEPDAEQRAAASSWDRATQSMEVLDAVELSLQKGRTMDVYQQQLTERLAFRGTMAALGCGLLLVGFAVVVFASLLGGIETVLDKRKLFPGWPILLLAMLALFLLLQAVPLMATGKRRGTKVDPPARNGP